jgi:hypothetical protein
MDSELKGRLRVLQRLHCACELTLEHGLVEHAKRSERIAGRGRIGRVGFDQQHRALATFELTAEILGYGNHELHRSQLERSRRERFGSDAACDPKVAAVFHRTDHAARIDTVVRAQHRGGQCFRIGVDGKAEQYELHYRHPDHHSEGQSIAPHLDELFG